MTSGRHVRHEPAPALRQSRDGTSAKPVRPDPLLALQRSCGNAVVLQLMRVHVPGRLARTPQAKPVAVETSQLTRTELHQWRARLVGLLEHAPDDAEVVAAMLDVDYAVRTGDHAAHPFAGLQDDFLTRVRTLSHSVLASLAPTAPPALSAREARSLVGTTEEAADRKVGNLYGGQVRTAMKPREMKGLMALCHALVKARPPTSFAYVMLGNSPAPLIACFAAYPQYFPGVVALSLPLSEIEDTAFDSWKDAAQQERMTAHLAAYVSVAKLQGRAPVLVDLSASGKSLRIAQWLLGEYFRAQGSPQEVHVQALNYAPQNFEALGPLPPTQLPVLASEEGTDRWAAQQAILERVLKDELLFRLWSRVPMSGIFRGDAPPPRLLLGEFQRMMADVLQIPNVLKEMADLT